MTSPLAGKRIVVTGGAGFIGSAVVEALVRRGVDRQDIVVPRSASCDLRVADHARRVMDGCHVVLHLAARTGGIPFSRSHPASQYYDCALMNLHVLEAARLARVEQVVAIGTLLAYPASAASPLREEALYDGKIAPTHLGIGMSKRDLALMGEMYHEEYGMNVSVVLSANAYGPRDRFEPAVAHVIPATIVKCYEGLKELVVWGDGTPTRDFLYVDDVAEGLVAAAEMLRGYHVLNLASGREVSIGELVRTIARLTEFQGEIQFDASKGGGDPKRGASIERAKQLLRFAPQVSLEEGLQRTIAWFVSQRQPAAARR